MGSTPSPERHLRRGPFAALAGPVVVLAIAAFAGHRALAYGLWGPTGPGSGLLPLICSVVLVLLALCDLMRGAASEDEPAPAVPSRVGSMMALPDDPLGTAVGDAEPDAPGAASQRPVLMYVAALIGLALLLDVLGFAASAFLSVVFVIHWAERRPWIESLAISAAAVFLVWLLFAVVLSVNLPPGRWSGWL